MKGRRVRSTLILVLWIGSSAESHPVPLSFDRNSRAYDRSEIFHPGSASADSARNTLSGILEKDTTLTAENGPWAFTGDVIVPDGVKLSIEAGSTVYFDSAVGLKVEKGGRLLVEGQEERRILFTRPPGATWRWEGMEFEESMEDNRLSYADMRFGDRQSHWILVQNSKLDIDHMTWDSTDKTVIEVDHPSLIISDSEFPDVSGIETIHGRYLRDEEYLILAGNTFGSPTGYNDVIDFSDCKRPGPILQIYNNTFLGGGDDGLDLDGCDAHIEGNLFKNFHLGHTSGTSNAIATGFRYEQTSDITVVRNVFYDNDHAILLKEGCFLHAENNVFVDCTEAAINFSEWPSRDVEPGKGAFLSGNIFWNNTRSFDNLVSQPGQPDPQLTVDRCVIPSDMFRFGDGNLDVDPRFVDPSGDFRLLSSSPCIGTGPNGLDMGAFVPAGISISGEPDSISMSDRATLTVGGPGITHYRFCLNDANGPWSEVFTIAEKPSIELSGLMDGRQYTVYVQGKNSAGVWQTEPPYGTSKTWTVQLTPASIPPDIAQTGVPARFTLYQNTPNPFNLSTRIEFELPTSCHVTLRIFDIHGRHVATLVKGLYPAGKHRIPWNAIEFPSGIYLYHLAAGDLKTSKRMILVK